MTARKKSALTWGLSIALGIVASVALVQLATAAPDPVVIADHATHVLPLATPRSPLAAASPALLDEAAATGWRGYRLGWGGVVSVVALYFGGRALIKRRGYVIRRWPRLNVGEAWATLSVLVAGAGGVLLPALMGDLTLPAALAWGMFGAGLLTRADVSAATAQIAGPT